MMSENRATDEECEQLLSQVFGQLEDLQSRIAPEGWEKSPYVRVHHPGPEQLYKESVQMHENLNSLFRNKDEPKPPPTFEEIQQDYDRADHTVKPLDELLDVFGGCIWAVFSNNHTVTGPQEEEFDLGSFRGTGSFLAKFIEKYFPQAPAFDYMDFYCADVFIERRADVTPLYELIFERLKDQRCDWSYAFPQIYLIDFSHSKEDPETDSPEAYDPNAALAEELEKAEKKAELDRVREKLDEAHRKEKEDALYKPPPMIVQAYRTVYGKWPQGWVH